MEGGVFRASAAVVDITPPVGFPLGGYIMRSGVSTGVLDPIRAKIGYITDGEFSVAIVGLDWIYILSGWGFTLREGIGESLGLDTRDVILTATHTHSGPGIFGSFQITDDSVRDEYLKGASEAILSASADLKTDARFVRVKKGKLAVEGLGANRNDPDGFFDDNLVGLSFVEDSGDIVLRLLNYGCHPTALGSDNLMFSSDFVGYGLDLLDERWGGVSIFMNGAAGDVSTRFTRKGRTAEERERFGGILFEASQFMQKISVPHRGDTLTVKSREVDVSYREIPDVKDSESIVEEIGGRIERGKKSGLPKEEMRRLESLREGALARLFISNLGGMEKIFSARKMEAEVELVMIGEMGILFLPGEVMSGSAMRLKTLSEFPLMVVGYANDYFGYLVEGDGDIEGGEGEYESIVAFLSDESIDRIFVAAENLIANRRE